MEYLVLFREWTVLVFFYVISVFIINDLCIHDLIFFIIFCIYSFSWRFYPKRLTIAIYVRGRTPLEK